MVGSCVWGVLRVWRQRSRKPRSVAKSVQWAFQFGLLQNVFRDLPSGDSAPLDEDFLSQQQNVAFRPRESGSEEQYAQRWRIAAERAAARLPDFNYFHSKSDAGLWRQPRRAEFHD